jgi:guanosine-3',5'-bis(diphosphate) 3'-pyrophosphohydrolase
VRIAEETMDIYAPLAGRMGMQGMREELEELAFRTHQSGSLSHRHRAAEGNVLERNMGVIGEIEDRARIAVREVRHRREVKAGRRSRGRCSARWRPRRCPSSSLSDIFGFRVVVDGRGLLSRALGAIHTTWSMVPGRFKDYISTPKQNDYRSIHTTIVGPSRQRIELQIRTAR